MVVHTYSPNTQEDGGKGSRKITKFPGMPHITFRGVAVPGERMEGRKDT